jgi:hypothetical protein
LPLLRRTKMGICSSQQALIFLKLNNRASFGV